jgi:hypothetical protein
MKKLITFSAFALAIGLVLNPSFIYTNASQAPAAHTGAPGEGTCATSGCHTGSSVITTGNFIVLSTAGANNLTSGYTPGTTYNMTLNVSAFNKPKYGFQITALDGSNNAAGDFNITNVNGTVRTTSGGRIYVGHKSASSTAAWSFQWIAPATDAGTVTFYVAGNGADNNILQTGDQIYTTSYTVSTSAGLTQGSGGSTGINVLNADDNGISIFPNPVKDRLFVSYNVAETENVTIDLYNLNGQIVQNLLNEKNSSGNYNESLSLNNNINKGLYIVRVNMGEKTFFKKVLVD